MQCESWLRALDRLPARLARAQEPYSWPSQSSKGWGLSLPQHQPTLGHPEQQGLVKGSPPMKDRRRLQPCTVGSVLAHET